MYSYGNMSLLGYQPIERVPGSVVKRSRHRPFTAVTRVRFPMESPLKKLDCTVLKRSDLRMIQSFSIASILKICVKICVNLYHFFS